MTNSHGNIDAEPTVGLAVLNEGVYREESAYERSPHLRHATIRDLLLAQLHAAVEDTRARGLPLSLLDVGAGTGPFSGPALAAGCTVTATDVAPSAVEKFNARFAANRRCVGVLDPDGDLKILGKEGFSIAMFASVLHHIPDYDKAIEDALEHLTTGGALLTFQDPMRYSRMPPAARILKDGAYLAWRITQRRDLVSGLASRWRRVTGHLDPSRPSDMVEYHVVRDGVDELAISRRLSARFERFALVRYWSSPSVLGQRLGEKVGAKSEFALVGLGYRGK